LSATITGVENDGQPSGTFFHLFHEWVELEQAAITTLVGWVSWWVGHSCWSATVRHLNICHCGTNTIVQYY
jgi:hypothetical protein